MNPNPFPLKGNIFENVWSLDEVKKDFFDQHYSLNFFSFLAHFLYRRGYNHLMREAQNCNPERHTSMVLFTGHFPTHECEIELNNFSCKDVGIWTCQMNGYKGKFYGLKKLNVTSINHCTYVNHKTYRYNYVISWISDCTSYFTKFFIEIIVWILDLQEQRFFRFVQFAYHLAPFQHQQLLLRLQRHLPFCLQGRKASWNYLRISCHVLRWWQRQLKPNPVYRIWSALHQHILKGLEQLERLCFQWQHFHQWFHRVRKRWYGPNKCKCKTN